MILFSYDTFLSYAKGHTYGAYHYDSGIDAMVCYCEHCGAMGQVQSVPESGVFGEIYSSDEVEDLFGELRPFYTIYEAENAEVSTEGGLSNSNTYIEYGNTSHGGSHVANISRIGNSITFNIEADENVETDLVFVVANVLYGDTGIVPIDNLGEYMEVTVVGESTTQVDLSYVSLMGDSSYNYYNWQYMLIRNVKLSKGTNSIELKPLMSSRGVSFPNIDTLYIFTDKAQQVTPIINFDIQGVYVKSSYGLKNPAEFKIEDSAYTLMSAFKTKGDIVLDVNVTGSISETLLMEVNYKSVNMTDIKLSVGRTYIVVPNVEIAYENSIFITLPPSVELFGVYASTDSGIIAPKVAELDTDYDYYSNSNTV